MTQAQIPLSQSLLTPYLVASRFGRRYLRLCFWHSYLVKSKAATKIQRIVRGCVTREFIRRWYLRRTFLVVIAQAVYRGNVEREKVKIVRKREDIAILIMQKIVRGVGISVAINLCLFCLWSTCQRRRC